MSLFVNPSLAVFLLPEGQRPRCVSVSYDVAKSTSRMQDVPVDIKSFKTLDPGIKKGDMVVIPTDTRWGLTVGRVEDVDLTVNFTSSETMRWIAGTFDKAAYDNILAREKELVGTVASAQQEAARTELADQLTKFAPGVSNFMLTGPAPPKPPPESEPTHRGGAQRVRYPVPPRDPEVF